ncbi:MAG: hypothetical protein A2Y45_04610 [Tenericutes bacterium GWC2_34_14]|nr:MAG: hypothetical protein A2Y45_04610 [Tenericutes bacterium GWC2_34_14]OHE34041.1 MAG: hypothetical protein A2012_05265 [Tenericutes bacterium GWE2_34_108]OHE35370.1 MAG: hypothetical protein A2Y46_04610 [Tenericutes bacterium GWF1_35_14]OHE38483.1 MAG: hypothetical protein A2Y44_08135 [Tenericutes bacterium GWF2_35_184]OHE43125.1 MAG: hypothetical protein A2221_05705 [Tenericutes bacterium RIFOXYA2_FULL_36_32]OHE45543.1 MAG: hypothetical protein A3K26_03640 [Tenericutes bacterium RIFOXYA1
MVNNARYTEAQIIKKYKRSIFVDQLIAFIPFVVSIFTKNTIDQLGDGFGNILIGVIFILTSGFYFTSDYFMNNSSIGKKIYHIEILMNDRKRKLLFLSIIIRRIMELTYHPLFKHDFVSHCEKIDTYTSTCILEKKRKDVINNKKKTNVVH